jgi:branched-chain amino acid transport system permease protein
MVAIMACFALGMNMMLRIGQLSIAQAAVAALGAYFAALVSVKLGYTGVWTILAGGLVVGLVCFLIGPLFIRVKGVYFVLLTFCAAQIVNLGLQSWVSLTGGNNGIYGIPKLEIFGSKIATPSALYAGALVLLAGTVSLIVTLYRSPVGKIMKSINEDEELCRSLGLNASRWRVAVFALSGMLTGIAGGYYAHYIGYLSPDAFRFSLAVDLLIINVVGGAGSILGPIVGSVFLVAGLETLRDAQEYRMLAYGVLLVTCTIYFRKGLVGLVDHLRPEKKK